MDLKEIGKVLTSKSVGTGPSSYEKRIYRPAVSQKLRNAGLGDKICNLSRSVKSRALFIDITTWR